MPLANGELIQTPQYTTIRITKEANEELKTMIEGRETAGDVIERMLKRRRKKV